MAVPQSTHRAEAHRGIFTTTADEEVRMGEVQLRSGVTSSWKVGWEAGGRRTSEGTQQRLSKTFALNGAICHLFRVALLTQW